MKNRKKGISLIVLIITIIVIIILAAAIILSITKINPIKSAKKAVEANDVKVAQEAVIVWIGDRWIEKKEEVGAYYTGIVKKEPSEVEINIDGNRTNIQVTLEELGLEMLEEVEIEKNVIKSIKKNGKRQETDDTILGGSEGSIPDNSVVIEKDEYENLKNQLEQEKNTVTEQQKQISLLETELENLKKEFVGGLKILEEGTINTGAINVGSGKYITIPLKNTYTEEDHARIVIYDAENATSNSAFYARIDAYNENTINHIVTGNSHTLYVTNVGRVSGSVTLKYWIIKELE